LKEKNLEKTSLLERDVTTLRGGRQVRPERANVQENRFSDSFSHGQSKKENE